MDLSNNNILHVKNGETEYLQFKKLLEYDKLVHCYTLKCNGMDFRRSLKTKEELQIVNNSYDKICKALQIKKENIVRPYQSHTDIIKYVERTGIEFKDVDGLITDKKDIDLMLTFADCTPILIYDPVKRIIANVHSGWRGTVQKIGQKAVMQLKENYNSNIKDLIVCIGPCIGKCHFEVENDVKTIFENEFNYLKRNSDIIEKSKTEDNKFFIDTTLINRLILEEIGIKKDNIIESNICTVCNYDKIHSHRAMKEKAGRNVAILGLRK